MNVVFVAPYAMAATVRFVRAVADVPGARVFAVSSDSIERFGDTPVAGHWQLDDCLDVDTLTGAVAEVGQRVGGVDCLL
ncbi:MAG TPA: hypothetical protein VFP09_05515, partial [Desertimonas sp.]|nr:hypothetical protein [Desertimonas sp.]